MDPDSRIRTLHLISSLHRRGAQVCAALLVDRLSRDGFQPTVWAIDPGLPSGGIVPARTLVLSPQAEGGMGFRRYRAFSSLVGALRTLRPHIVHAHGGRALKYAVATKPFWRPRAYVYTKIGSIRPWLDHPLKRRFYRILFENVDIIISVADALRQEIEITFRPVRPRLTMIHTGVDPRPFAEITPSHVAEKRAELGLEPTDVCLMMVGSLSWEKNPQLLIALLGEMAVEYPGLRLLFVGEGPLEPALRREALGAGLQERICFLGVRGDVAELLSAADIIVLCSHTEGLPGVLIEAGMANRPVVAFDVGAVNEVVVDGVSGFLVPAGNRTMLKERILRLVREPVLRAVMGREACRRCRAKFDVHRYIEQHETLFRELVRRSDQHRSMSHGTPAAGEARVPARMSLGQGDDV
jgi:glycosyltransferase involved in cell wall biosynthesis